MSHVSKAVQRTGRSLAALLAAAALAGCMITSEAELVSDSEAQRVWPPAVFVYGYEKDDAAPGTFRRSDEAPLGFTLTGNSYVSADGSMSLRFVPLEESDTYMIAMVSADGSIYGTATYRNDILAAGVMVDADPVAAIAAERSSGADSGALAGATIEDGGIVLTTREALDHVIAMSREGKLPLDGLVMVVDERADAATPARIVPNGAFYRGAD